MATSQTGEQRVEVIVLGAGAAGSATVWWLARRGRTVVLVDQFAPGHRRGSSHGTERIFRLVYAEREYVRMCVEAWPLWAELERDTGATLLTRTGGVDIGPPHDLQLLQAACSAEGVAVEMVDDVRTVAPGLRHRVPALLQRDGGTTHADATLAALRGRAAALAATVLHEDKVVAVEPDDAAVRVLLASGRRLVGDACVVTAGAWAAPVLDGLVDLPPITVTKEQVAFFRPTAPHPWPTFIGHGDVPVYGMATPDGLVKVGEHHTGPVVDPDRRDDEVEPGAWRRVVGWAADNICDIEPQPVHHVTCLYASGPGEAFVIDRVGRLVIGVGFGGHGFKFTPLLGRRLADLADLTSPDPDPTAPFTLASHRRGHAFTVGANGHH